MQRAQSGDLAARDELLFRFSRLIASLVRICITGKYNYRSSYHTKFLQLFTKKGTPLPNMAAKLKASLVGYDPKELFIVGQTAILEAILRCESNLASTIVICFKEEVEEIIKGRVDLPSVDGDEGPTPLEKVESEILVDLLLSSVSQADSLIIVKALRGEMPPSQVPKRIKILVAEYLWGEYPEDSEF